MKRLSWLFGVLLFGLFVCGNGRAVAEEIKISGGAAPMENIFKRVKDAFEKSSGMTLTITASGPIDAFKDLDQGKADGCSAGLTFPAWLELLEKNNYKVADSKIFKFRVIGKDNVRILTHKDNPVKELSKDQLKGIFSGTISNWKEVGGADLSIIVLWGTKIEGTNSVFSKAVLGDTPLIKNVKKATNAEDIKKQLINIPGGIGLGPISIIDSTIAAPSIPEIGRPITFVTKGPPSEKIIKLLDFVSGEGKKLILQ